MHSRCYKTDFFDCVHRDSNISRDNGCCTFNASVKIISRLIDNENNYIQWSKTHPRCRHTSGINAHNFVFSQSNYNI